MAHGPRPTARLGRRSGDSSSSSSSKACKAFAPPSGFRLSPEKKRSTAVSCCPRPARQLHRRPTQSRRLLCLSPRPGDKWPDTATWRVSLTVRRLPTCDVHCHPTPDHHLRRAIVARPSIPGTSPALLPSCPSALRCRTLHHRMPERTIVPSCLCAARVSVRHFTLLRGAPWPVAQIPYLYPRAVCVVATLHGRRPLAPLCPPLSVMSNPQVHRG
ncbi:hypothetical protein BS50DRAFT_669197 [Corynespora cassiicola Philippines]|uniref:Uncharacterized protein n=1 Tax=Corynespora cassiicola Philippines TaxID=1448308 RepID=A0A2T2NLQ0_CORCC|nr:hypothetical protein BS50DRAFT_669197 [Corynespora cassiicola Philippines]